MDKAALRRALVEERLNLPDRLQRADALQRVMRLWLLNQSDTVIGAYWPIKGEFDPLPALHRWKEDAYGIPKPKDTELIVPTLLFVPCVGYGPGGYRLGYGGGFYDRTLASLQPRPATVGLGYTVGYLDDFEPEPHDLPLDAILNDNGVVWPV
jgi:5-formyltetrahydrofolate cyclo-ligase